MAAGIRHRVLRYVVYSHLWLALGAAAQTWWMGELLSTSGWRAPLFAFCTTIVCYTYMRWARMDDPAVSSSPHVYWFRQNKWAMYPMAAAAGIVGLLVGWPDAMELLRTFWPVVAIAMLYVIPSQVTRGRHIGLRNIPLAKSLLIAFGWSSITVGLPVIMVGGWDEQAWWAFTMQFAFFLSIAIAFDVRDLPFDRRSLRTLPQLLGPKSAKFFAVMFQLPWFFFFFTLALFSLAPIEQVTPRGFLMVPMLLPALGLVITGYMVARSSSERSEIYFSFTLDGMLILIPLLGWIGSYF